VPTSDERVLHHDAKDAIRAEFQDVENIGGALAIDTTDPLNCERLRRK
jgi:hypothetical protein